MSSDEIQLNEVGAATPTDSDTIDVSIIDVRLPCRSFRIGFKVAEPGEFSLTTEFLLRLLRATGSFPETGVADFFGFTSEETRFVVNHVEGQGYARRNDGRVHLTEAGHRLFDAGDQPALFEVRAKEERFDFDLISFAPADHYKLDDFELKLPELTLPETDEAEQTSSHILRAFRHFYQEFRMRRGGTRAEKQSLYSVDSVQAELRYSTLVPITVAVRKNDPKYFEANLIGWRSGAELDERAEINERCAAFVKELQSRSEEMDAAAISALANVAPAQLAGALQDTAIKPESFFRIAAKQVGELRIDRPTVRIIGHLWTDANRVKFATALKYATASLSSAPPMQLWLRPNVQHWGATRRLPTILSAVAKQFEGAGGAVKSVLVGGWRSREPLKAAFNGVVSIHDKDLPRGLEIFLVPDHLVFVAVLAPIGDMEGYPVPLGIISFDKAAVARAQRLLADVLGSTSAQLQHCDWGGERGLADIRAAISKLEPESTPLN